MNTKLKKNTKTDFEKAFFRNSVIFRKTIKNVRNYRNIKLITTRERKKYFVSESNYHTTKNFSENLLAIEMKGTQIFIHKPKYLDLSILEMSKAAMYEP